MGKSRFMLAALAAALSCLCTPAPADDGFSELAAGGLVFAKSDSVSMDTEALRITPERVTVSYVFKNHSAKDVTAVVAFPMPTVGCDAFDRLSYPDDFVTTVDGQPVHMELEERAFIRGDADDRVNSGGYKAGQEITGLLKEKGLPLDCRQAIPPGRHQTSPTYQALVKLGLAQDMQEDPYSIYYGSELKYHWDQVFPAGSDVQISHAYRPSYGAGVAPVPESYSAYYRNEAAYRRFFMADPALASYAAAVKEPGKADYVDVQFILKSANSWDGPIKDFTLDLGKPACFIVTSLDAAPVLKSGELVIEMHDFTPDADLEVFYQGQGCVPAKFRH